MYEEFSRGVGQKKDYSGFERQNWADRCNSSHRRHSRKLSKAKSKKKYDEIAKKYGIHYSILVDKLEYFDSVRFHVIDPMHNLFLGIAKKTWKVWKEHYFKKQRFVLASRILCQPVITRNEVQKSDAFC